MTYREKKEELMKKYIEEIANVEKNKGVDMGVCWDMLDSYARGLGVNPLDYELSEERLAELKADVNELLDIAVGQVKGE